MKSVSALILVCAFVCASAQFGVKGGSSGSQGGSFFPRLTPGSIQEKKDQLQLANVDDGSSGFVQPVSQVVAQPVGQTVVQPARPQENVVTVISDRPQGVLVPSSGAVSSFGQVPVSVVGQVAPQPQFIQSVAPQPQFVQSVPSSFGSFQSFVPTFQSVPVSGQQSGFVQSVPSIFTPGSVNYLRPSERYLFDKRQPGQLVQFGAPSTGAGFPGAGFTQNIVHLSNARPQATFQTVPSFVSSDNGFGSSSGSSGNGFSGPSGSGAGFGSSSGFGSTFVPQAVGKVVKQVAGPIVNQPFPTFSSFPSTVPVASFPTVNPSSQFVSAGKVFTDNKLSGFSGQQPTVISQEKQLADTVQTTEW
ncbi:nucleoporin-like protein 2 isoform X2 [Tetranychus urticae]|uniref:nucleoporin-like protein 2 isoform X2 n=1 Tax=Tetranychus urticae TaxID=32264 RepID=UPI00077C0031|nr:nucleoporin-like protein 2 isoform X2 [Tetranychus urticae]